MHLRVVCGAVLILASGVGCGGSNSQQGAQERGTPSVAASPAPTGTPDTSLAGPLARCGPQPAQVGGAGFRYRVLHDPKVGAVPAVTAGKGPIVAVLLHQTDGDGFCGWLPFAAKIVKNPMVAVVAIDLCGYGLASCHGTARPTDAASVAIGFARRDLRARRVVVVGASMGGSVALITAVNDSRVDAAADLSGPIEWPGTESVRGGHALRVPVLVAMADTEATYEVEGARDIVGHAPGGSRFLEPAAGHGYDLLRDLDGRPGPLVAPLLAWITDRHAGDKSRS